MAEQINLNKTVYSKNQFEKVIDTSFTQLVEPVPTVSLVAPTISVAEFFQNYQQIFFQIPKFGELNSHEYLIKTTQLRQENLDLQQLINPQLTGSI
jgi:hypothetical protein